MKTTFVTTQEGHALLEGARPVYNKKTGEVKVTTPNGLVVNSLLRKDEWESLDQAVVDAARQNLVAAEAIRSAGLTKTEGFGALVSQWNTSSEMTAADVNMSGEARDTMDRVDFNLQGVPLPVLGKSYRISRRELEAARALGSSLDATHAFEAGRVISETVEDMVLNGYSLTFNGNTIYGLTNHPNRNTGTAASYGGGDWGTIANVTGTVEGMITAAQNDFFYGPYLLMASTTQYNQARNAFYTDGSGQTPFQRVMQMSNITDFIQVPRLADGNVVLVNLSRNVIDLAIVPGFDLVNLEWASPDGMTSFFRVVSVFAPRVKADYANRSGIVHATGA